MNDRIFYCQKKCTDVDFSIEEWNKGFKICIELNLDEKAIAKILEGEDCSEQCFDCVAIIGNRRIKTQALINKDKPKELIIDGVSNSLQERGVSQKMIETEDFVDTHLRVFGKPPTYKQVADYFGLASTNTAYNRLRHCREKMISRQ